MKKLFALSAVALLVGCEGETIDPRLVDEHRIISRDNAVFNAKQYVNSLGEAAVGVAIQGQSDSSIKSNCPYGDGWGTVNLIKGGRHKGKLKCQTFGSGKGVYGCLPEADFKTKEYAREEGTCNREVTGLPKLGG